MSDKIRLVDADAKLYTLEEAYQIILKEKKKMGILEYLDKQLRTEYWKGYNAGIERARLALNKIITFEP